MSPAIQKPSCEEIMINGSIQRRHSAFSETPNPRLLRCTCTVWPLARPEFTRALNPVPPSSYLKSPRLIQYEHSSHHSDYASHILDEVKTCEVLRCIPKSVCWRKNSLELGEPSDVAKRRGKDLSWACLRQCYSTNIMQMQNMVSSNCESPTSCLAVSIIWASPGGRINMVAGRNVPNIFPRLQTGCYLHVS